LTALLAQTSLLKNSVGVFRYGDDVFESYFIAGSESIRCALCENFSLALRFIIY
jgi:hypothetical protein